MSTENRISWRTYLIAGGALLSCGLGVFALHRLRRLPERTVAPDATDTQRRQYVERSTPTTTEELKQRESFKERNDAVRAKSACSTWMQTFDEVTIEIPVGADVKKKDIECTFNTKSLTVAIKAAPLIEGSLYQAITPEECTWELDGEGANRVLTISLIKGAFHGGHWNQVILEDSVNNNQNQQEI